MRDCGRDELQYRWFFHWACGNPIPGSQTLDRQAKTGFVNSYIVESMEVMDE